MPALTIGYYSPEAPPRHCRHRSYTPSRPQFPDTLLASHSEASPASTVARPPTKRGQRDDQAAARKGEEIEPRYGPRRSAAALARGSTAAQPAGTAYMGGVAAEAVVQTAPAEDSTPHGLTRV